MLKYFIKKVNIFCFLYRGWRGKQIKWVKIHLQSQKNSTKLQRFWVPVLCYSLLENSVPKVFVSFFHQKLVERHGECGQTETPVELSTEQMCWTQLSPKKYSPCSSKPISSPFCKASTCNDWVSRSAASDIQVTVLICQSHNSTVPVLLLWIGSDQGRTETKQGRTGIRRYIPEGCMKFKTMVQSSLVQDIHLCCSIQIFRINWIQRIW